MRYGADYYRLKKVRDRISRIICDERTPARDVPRCVTALISLERFIREMRGIPPLAPISFRELMEIKQMKQRHKLKRVRVLDVPIEARPAPSQTGGHAIKEIPGRASAKIVVEKTSANGAEAYPPDKPLPTDTFQIGDTHNHHTSPADPQKMIPPREKPLPQPEIRRARTSAQTKQQCEV
jgi:hypothetical protein